MAAYTCVTTATCVTCASVFHEQDEDGRPEIPGQRCAIEDCPTWICDGGCAEHHSLVCGCGQRVCSQHVVNRQGYEAMCAACAERLLATCRECDAAPVERRYADGLGACAACHAKLERASKSCPPCPACGHRMWVRDMDERRYEGRGLAVVVQRPGRMFRCDCGSKFTREAAAPEPRVLFAPRMG